MAARRYYPAVPLLDDGERRPFCNPKPVHLRVARTLRECKGSRDAKGRQVAFNCERPSLRTESYMEFERTDRGQ